MKFTDGFWQTRPGVSSLFGQEVYDVETADDGRSLVVTAPTKVIAHRGDTLNRHRRAQADREHRAVELADGGRDRRRGHALRGRP
jgi:hypothetical protein